MKHKEFLSSLRFFRKTQEKENDRDAGPSRNWVEDRCGGREWEDLYRRRWQYDQVVRSTHGVNCTGSCSWNVYVKDGMIVWETQKLDYPQVGVDLPAYEPRGCPRGATFSWYVYSPVRVKYPYVRAALLELWHEALKDRNDPVAAWKSIVGDPQRAKRYREARGKGGFIRVSWEEANLIIAAALVATIQDYGPDRIWRTLHGSAFPCPAPKEWRPVRFTSLSTGIGPGDGGAKRHLFLLHGHRPLAV